MLLYDPAKRISAKAALQHVCARLVCVDTLMSIRYFTGSQ